MFAVDSEWPVSQETEFESAHRRHRQPRKISFDLEDEADEVSEEGIFPSSEEAARERDPPPSLVLVATTLILTESEVAVVVVVGDWLIIAGAATGNGRGA